MKRTRVAIIGLVMLLVLSNIVLGACARTKYKAGTYMGEGNKRQYGYETADVTVDGNKITNIVLHRLTADGQEVNYDEWTGQPGPDGRVRPDLKQYRQTLAQQMIEKQSTEVDNITGATDSVTGWKQAVQQALQKATR